MSPPLPQPASQQHFVRASMSVTGLTVEREAFRKGSTRLGKAQQAEPTRWRTREFYLYYLVIVSAVSFMIYVPIGLSRYDHPNFQKYAHKLRFGWIAGRPIDISDTQYRQFRQGLPDLLLLAVIQITSWHAIDFVLRTIFKRQLRRVTYLACSSVVVIFLLHGINAFKILLIMAGNLEITKRIAGRGIIAPISIWIYNLGILFGNEIFDGYPFSILHPSLSFLDQLSWKGLMPRWQISFNITVLRLLSYALETHWASQKGEQIARGVGVPYALIGPHKLRLKQETKPKELYTAYILYTPLYIAGPIMRPHTEMQTPVRIPIRQIIAYAIRFLACLLTMELVLHYMYVVAIKDTKAWQGDSPMELCMIGFWNLIVIWLKLLLPWRFFRLWALADGMNPPENMIRCMANNYSVTNFWRSWHRSYNLWLLRYIYIPLGGSKRPFIATICVFTFVALWHDLTLRLLTWGWTVSIFVLPELLGKRYASQSGVTTKSYYRHLSALGGVFNILLLLTANLIGFAIGVDGMRFMAGQIFGSLQGIVSLLLACGVLFTAVQVMFEYRAQELREGIDRKC